MNLSIIIPLSPNLKLEPSKDCNTKEIYTILVEGLNPSKNRNVGIQQSNTELVAFINGHTILTNNWLEQVKKFFKSYPEVDVLGGPQLGWEGDNLFAQSSSLALVSKFGAAGASNRYGGKKLILDANETHIGSWNLICRKKVFERVLFDETLYPGEDPKFISDAQKSGFKMAFSPDIIVHNKKRGTALGLAKQIFGYGTARPKKESLIQTMKHPTFLIPALFVLYLPFFWLFKLPLGLYLLLGLIFSIYSAEDTKTFLCLLFIFPIIHISYGVGFIWGVLNK